MQPYLPAFTIWLKLTARVKNNAVSLKVSVSVSVRDMKGRLIHLISRQSIMKDNLSLVQAWIDADFDVDDDDFGGISTTAPTAKTVSAKSFDLSRKRKSFLDPPRDKASAPSSQSQRLAFKDDVQLWIDRHQPKTVSDLAVHPKKVEEIKFWFEQNVTNGSKKRAKVNFQASI